MAKFLHPAPNNSDRILWAISLSVIAHILVFVIVPKMHIDEIKKPETFTVELTAPPSAAQEPIAAVATEELMPEPPPPEPPKPKIKTEPTPKLVQKPSEMAQPPVHEAPAEPAPPVITSQKSEPSFIAPSNPAPTPPVEAPPAPTKPAGPSQREIDTARDAYGNMLANAIGKYKQYPRVAQIRGWEGQVNLELEMDGNGNVLSVKIVQSSGHKVLDDQALEMVKKASPLPAAPDTLRGKTFTVFIPVPFRLETN